MIMARLLPFVGAILIFFISVCYGNEDNPTKTFVCSTPPSSSFPSSSSSSSFSADVEAGIFGSEDSSHGKSIVIESGGRSKDPHWIQTEVDPIHRKRRSAAMNGRLLQRPQLLDSTDDVIPGVRYNNRLLLHPGDVKFIYESGLDDPSRQEEVVVDSAKDDGRQFGWRYPPVGIDDDGSSGIWKAYKELGLLRERADPEPVYETERKRKWKSKNMAMWG